MPYDVHPIRTGADLEDAVRAFQQSRVILTAMELDVFNRCAAGPRSAADIAREIGSDPRTTEMLLNALCALGLLNKRGDRFSCSATARNHLTDQATHDLRPVLRHMNGLWNSWSFLTDAVRTGRPPRRKSASPDPEAARAFIGAMHAFAIEQAPVFLDRLPLGAPRHILDLGTGSGAFAMEFARRFPEAEVTAFDFPHILELTAEFVRQAGMEHRVRLLPGNMLADDFGGNYDLVWLSHVVHSCSPEEAATLFRRVARALRPGGRVMVRDFVLDESGTQPGFAALFSLNMLVNTAGGASYRLDQYAEWMRDAGLTGPERLHFPDWGAASVLIAALPTAS